MNEFTAAAVDARHREHTAPMTFGGLDESGTVLTFTADITLPAGVDTIIGYRLYAPDGVLLSWRYLDSAPSFSRDDPLTPVSVNADVEGVTVTWNIHFDDFTKVRAASALTLGAPA